MGKSNLVHLIRKCRSQNCFVTPLLIWIGEREYKERLMGLDKDEERSLSNYSQGQNRLHSEKLVYFITNEIRVG